MSKVYGRGRLTDEDRERIDALAERGLLAGAIARQIQRHPATVSWYMVSNGLRAPKLSHKRRATYVRGGITVHPFSAEEDAFIQALRIQDFSIARIAEIAGKRFGVVRKHHVIRCRLIMLAAGNGDPEHG